MPFLPNLNVVTRNHLIITLIIWLVFSMPFVGMLYMFLFPYLEYDEDRENLTFDDCLEIALQSYGIDEKELPMDLFNDQESGERPGFSKYSYEMHMHKIREQINQKREETKIYNNFEDLANVNYDPDKEDGDDYNIMFKYQAMYEAAIDEWDRYTYMSHPEDGYSLDYLILATTAPFIDYEWFEIEDLEVPFDFIDDDFILLKSSYDWSFENLELSSDATDFNYVKKSRIFEYIQYNEHNHTKIYDYENECEKFNYFDEMLLYSMTESIIPNSEADKSKKSFTDEEELNDMHIDNESISVGAVFSEEEKNIAFCNFTEEEYEQFYSGEKQEADFFSSDDESYF